MLVHCKEVELVLVAAIAGKDVVHTLVSAWVKVTMNSQVFGLLDYHWQVYTKLFGIYLRVVAIEDLPTEFLQIFLQ